jgi:nicotinate-nucleotide adenylyltransferase
MLKLGILGGTFDPIHMAHLAVAEQARTQLGLEQVLFIPAWLAPHKKGNTRAADRAADRVAMLRLALQDNPAFILDESEIHRRGTSYTVETLRRLHERMASAAHLHLLIGADNYAIFHRWREPEEILRLATPVVYPRMNVPLATVAPPFRVLEGPTFELHATWIRAAVARGQSIRYLVPERVREYIAAHHLYRLPEE